MLIGGLLPGELTAATARDTAPLIAPLCGTTAERPLSPHAPPAAPAKHCGLCAVCSAGFAGLLPRSAGQEFSWRVPDGVMHGAVPHYHAPPVRLVEYEAAQPRAPPRPFS